MRRSPLPVLVAAALALLPQAARAHAIETDLQAPAASHSHHGAATYHLHSAFSSGEPARDATVLLLARGAAEPIELGRTDSQGRLAFVVPADSGPDAEIQVDAGAGHRDWIALSEGTAPDGQQLQGSRQLRQTLLGATPLAALGLLSGLVLIRQRSGRR